MKVIALVIDGQVIYILVQISPKLIKIARPKIANVLTGVINNAIDKGISPDSFKRAQVTPVFKKADNLSKENHRPVSILPCLSKIFKRVIANKLNEYFEGIFHESLLGVVTAVRILY